MYTVLPSIPRLSPRASLRGLSIMLALVSALAAPGSLLAKTDLEPGKLIETKPARPVPELGITDLANEQPASLAAYRGKKLIVNLWATWCGPCVAEMPSLLKLAASLKDQNVAVIAISSEDRGGKFVVDPFLKDHNLNDMTVFLDKTMSTSKAMGQSSILPMTLLIDQDGNEIARVMGDRDWNSADSVAEIRKLFDLKG